MKSVTIKFTITSLIAICVCLFIGFYKKTHTHIDPNLPFFSVIIIIISSVFSGIYFSKLMQQELIFKNENENKFVVLYLIIAILFALLIYSGNVVLSLKNSETPYQFLILYPIIMFGIFLFQNITIIIPFLLAKFK